MKLPHFPSWARTRVEFNPAQRRDCEIEIDRTFPDESGGVLMGHWLSTDHVMIDHVLGPGPAACHERFSFRPDLAWQHERIADIYERTFTQSTYLGDWHSHPNALSGRLSSKDKGVLAQIMGTPEAMCLEPLMGIFWGRPRAWELTVWRAGPRLHPLSWTAVRTSQCDLVSSSPDPRAR